MIYKIFHILFQKLCLTFETLYQDISFKITRTTQKSRNCLINKEIFYLDIKIQLSRCSSLFPINIKQIRNNFFNLHYREIETEVTCLLELLKNSSILDQYFLFSKILFEEVI